MADIAEQICQAVDMIVEERLRSVNFDTTITAIILDNRYAKINQYTCYNGSSQFTAYSKDTSFEINDSVLVTIPNNDYSQQKIIIGKYVAENDKPFSYVKPFNTIIDVSSNLVSGWGDKIASLLANEDYDLAEKDSNEKLKIFSTEVPLWSNTFEEEFVGFNKLGIQGQFRSWLKNLKAQEGDFGYRLEILSNNGDLIEEEDKETSETFNSLLKAWSILYSNIINKKDYTNPEGLLGVTPESWFESLNVTKNDFINAFIAEKDFSEQRRKMVYAMLNAHSQITTLYLNTEEMYGNPYDYSSFLEQEAVFNISDIKNIVSMSLYFYQASNTFFNNAHEPLKYKKEGGSKFNDNLFTKSPYICLGYDLSDFDQEQAILYSIDGDTYVTKDNLDPKYNKKTIRLRWLHKFENGQIKVITEAADLDYEVRWYRYKLGASSADEYSGVYWTRVEPNLESSFTYVLDPEANIGSEQIKAIVLHKGKIIRSNILTFYNEKEVVSEVTAELLSGLSLWCKDKSYGNYYIYGQNNNLFDDSKANKILTLSAKFQEFSLLTSPGDYEIENAPDLEEAINIVWEFPLKNTMLVVQGFNYNFRIDEQEKIYDTNGNLVAIDWASIAKNDPQGQRYKLDSRYDNVAIKVVGNTIYITRECNEDGSINNEQEYRVAKTFSQSNLNNTVKCTIRKNSLYYSATKEFSFGLMGTNGTDATLVIDFDNNKTALTANKAGESLPISVHLYDSTHTEYDLNNVDLNITCKWEWFAYNEVLPDEQKASVIEQYLNWMKKNNLEAYRALLVQGVIPESTKEELYPDALKMYGSIRIENSNKPTCNISHANTLDIDTGNLFQILQVTLSGFGDYDLIAYKPIPIRRSAIYRNIVGPTEIIYDSSGHVDYFKTPYEMWWCPDTSKIDQTYDTVAAQTDVSVMTSDWDIYNPYYESWTMIGSFGNQNNILRPAPIYIEDADPYGVACYLNTESGNIKVWIQPLVVLQNKYPSATLNAWSGKSVELNEGSIIAPAIAAGKKNSDNTFSGVMLGDWRETNTEGSITEQTGIYGFHYGSQSFAFKEDGTAFIGKNGYGRIIFDGNSGVLKSAAWGAKDPQTGRSVETGMHLDLDDGILKLQKEPGFDQVLLTSETYSPGIYWILKTTPINVPKNTKYATDFNYTTAEGKTEVFDCNESTVYYIQAMVPVSRLDSVSFAIKVKNGKLYTRSALQYTQCTTNSVYSQYNTYYEYVYVAESNVTQEVFDKNKDNYYIKNADGTYNKASGNYAEGITYYTRSLQQTAVTKEQFEANPTNYYTRREYTYTLVPSDATYNETVTYYEEGYEAQNYGLTPPDITIWNTYQDSNYGKYYVIIEEFIPCNEEDFDPTQTYYQDNRGTSARYITLSAAASRFPLAIGNHSSESSRKFRVDWDGTCYIQDGVFSGDIDAETGYLGDLVLRGGLTLNKYGYIAANKDSLNDFSTSGFWLDYEGLNIGNKINYFYASTDFTGFFNVDGGTKITGNGIDLFHNLTSNSAYTVFSGNSEGLMHLGWETNNYSYPYIRFGFGTSTANTYDAGVVKKYGGGMWIGTFGSNSTGTSPQDDTNSTVGIFCNSNDNTVYRCEIINKTRVWEPARYARFA